MNFNIEQGQSLFKHSIDEVPDINDPDFKPHAHKNTYELFYFIAGDADFNIAGNFYEMRNGTLLLIKPGVVHNINFKSRKRYERIVLRFKEKDLDKKLADRIKETDNIYFVRNSELSNEILRLDAHFSNIDNDWILFTFQSSLQIILSYVVNYKASISQYNYSDEVKTIINYIEDNLTEIESIDQICEVLNVSKSALCKKFTEAVGIPIMSFIRLRKTILAHSLIEQGNKPTQIYSQCGFKDYATFYRCYKKVYRQNPSTKQDDTMEQLKTTSQV